MYIKNYSNYSAYCRYGSSPANQRIESWWSYLRRNHTNWWINFFKDMIERGVLNTANPLHMECLWFCFSGILKQELDSIKEHWNSHYIRWSRHDTIAGKPDVLYYLSESAGAKNHIKPVTTAQFEDMSQHCDESEESEDNNFQEYFKFITDHEGIQSPTNWSNANEVYQQLLAIADPV